MRVLPPSSGWEAVDNGQYPVPGVILHRYEQQQIDKDEEERYNSDMKNNAYSPIDMFEYDFNIQLPLGFQLRLNQNLLCIELIDDRSQAQELGLMVGDILCYCDDEDISLMGDEKKLMKYLDDEIIDLRERQQKFMTLRFGRRKLTFPIVLAQRSGVKGMIKYPFVYNFA